MSRRTYAAALLLCAACFHPTGQVDTTDAASTSPGTSTTSDATTTATSGTTGDATTVAPTSTTGVTATTGGTTGGATGCADAPDPDADCAAHQPGTPHCDLEASVCVECVQQSDCGSLASICDPDTHACVECVQDLDCDMNVEPACNPETQACGCTEHSDCPDTACELDVGTCFPKELTEVLYSRASVDPTCPEKFCDAGDPCCSVSDAFTKAVLTGKQYIVIRVEPPLAPGPKDPGLTIDPTANGKRIAILGAGMPAFETEAGNLPLVFISAAAKVYVAGVALRAKVTDTGFACLGGAGAWVDDVLVDDLPNGVAFFAGKCPLTIRRAVVRNVSGGVHIGADGVGRIADTIIAAPSDFALRAELGGTLDVVFSTVFERTGAAGRLLQCADPAAKLVARNAILVADPELGSNGCNTAAVTASVVTADALVGPTVAAVDPAELDKLFLDLAGGDLHIKPGAAVFNDVAVRQVGDPLTDVDRQPRPLGGGALDWAGADRP